MYKNQARLLVYTSRVLGLGPSGARSPTLSLSPTAFGFAPQTHVAPEIKDEIAWHLADLLGRVKV